MVGKDVVYELNQGKSLDNCLHLGIAYNATFLETIGRHFNYAEKKFIVTDVSYNLEKESPRSLLIRSRVKVLVQEVM